MNKPLIRCLFFLLLFGLSACEAPATTDTASPTTSIDTQATTPTVSTTIVTTQATTYTIPATSADVSGYSVSFSTNGGNEIPWAMIDDIIANPEAFIPIKEGHSFVGWYLDHELLTPATSLTEITENIMLYAKWDTNVYTIDFLFRGVSVAQQRSFPYGEELAFHVFPDPELGGEYETWAGWFEDTNGELPFSQGGMPARNLTLHARYVPVQYWLDFNKIEVPSINMYEYQLRVGDFMTVAFSASRVYAWGWYDLGELDSGAMINTTRPVELTSFLGLNSGEEIIDAAAGGYHALLWTSTGRVFAWGNNAAGQLGDGTTDHRLSPVEITSSLQLAPGEAVETVVSGAYHNLLLTTDKRLLAWGYNGDGQLGLGSEEPLFEVSPIDITASLPLVGGDRVKAIYAGSQVNFVITEQEHIISWGRNRNLLLAVGNSNGSLFAPTDVTANFPLNNGEKIVILTIGEDHGHVLTTENRILSWGSSGTGALGAGDTYFSAYPIDTTTHFVLLPEERIVMIKAGGFHSAAVSSNNRLFVWGYNIPKILGDGTSTNRNTPMDITNRLDLKPNETITNIALRLNRSYLITDQERLFGWGGPSDSLGINQSQPIDIPTLMSFGSLPIASYNTWVDHGTRLGDILPGMIEEEVVGWYWDQALSDPVDLDEIVTNYVHLYAKVIGD